jgi:FtsP/CotA-like multicopper oxidase with cupredoxin domain
VKELTMRAHRRTLLVLATLAATVLVLGPASAPSQTPTRTFDLCAKAGTVALPGGATAPIWGFASKPEGVACSDASVTPALPGPELAATVGETVTLNVTNALPAGHTISIEAPGVAFDAGPSDAAPGATVTRTFTAAAAGTHLYASAGDAGRQQAMGLYGALVVRPAGASPYEVERTLVLSELDPAFNADPDGFDMLDWAPTYWLIDGKAYPQTAMLDVHAGDDVLVRYVNAGLEHVTMTLLGRHMQVLARDGRPAADVRNVVAQTVPAGATVDAAVTIPAGAAVGDRYALYDRQLHLTNGSPGGPAHAPGGRLTFVRVVA